MKEMLPKVMKFAGAVAVIVVAFYVYDWMKERQAKKLASSTTSPDVVVAEA